MWTELVVCYSLVLLAERLIPVPQKNGCTLFYTAALGWCYHIVAGITLAMPASSRQRISVSGTKLNASHGFHSLILRQLEV